MSRWYWLHVLKSSRAIFIGKCQCTREALEAQLAKDLPDRRWSIAGNGEVIIY